MENEKQIFWMNQRQMFTQFKKKSEVAIKANIGVTQ